MTLMNKIVQYFRKGEIIFQEGMTGDKVYRIVSGSVIVCKTTPQGKRIPLAQLSNGEIFGEMCLLEGSGKRSATVIAVTNVQLEVFYEEEFYRLFTANPEGFAHILSLLSGRLRGTSSQLTKMFKEKVIPGSPMGTFTLPSGSVRESR